MRLRKIAIAFAFSAPLMLFASAGHAQDITRTYDINATGFNDGNGDLASYQTFSASYTITFDPSADIGPTTGGLTVNFISLPYSSEYAYAVSDDDLSIGSNVIDGNSFGDPDSSYGLFITNAVSAAPGSDDVTYTTADGHIFNSTVQTVTLGSVSAAPEPSTWLLTLAGVGGIGLMLRRARKTMGFRFGDALSA